LTESNNNEGTSLIVKNNKYPSNRESAFQKQRFGSKAHLVAIASGNIASPFLKDPTVWPFGVGRRLKDNYELRETEDKLTNIR
jgi:hypothetical protein